MRRFNGVSRVMCPAVAYRAQLFHGSEATGLA
jgi:hypothetical protein